MAAKRVKAKAAVPNLSKLQKTINQSASLRAQFLKDPAGVLEKPGLKLPADKAAQVARFANEVRTAKGQASIAGIRRKGTGTGPKAMVVNVSAKISL